MKYTFLLFLLTIILFLPGCRRNYKVIHARPVVDTLAHDDIENEDKSIIDEPLMEIPDIPEEVDIMNRDSKAEKEYDDYIHGR